MTVWLRVARNDFLLDVGHAMSIRLGSGLYYKLDDPPCHHTRTSCGQDRSERAQSDKLRLKSDTSRRLFGRIADEGSLRFRLKWITTMLH